MLSAAINIPSNRDAIEALLEGFVMLDEVILWERTKAGLVTPDIYESGVVYRNEPPGKDHWATVGEILKARWGDCEDFAGWRAAELRRKGEKGARAVALPTRKGKWHAVVMRAGGRIEDPSKILLRLERERKGKR